MSDKLPLAGSADRPRPTSNDATLRAVFQLRRFADIDARCRVAAPSHGRSRQATPVQLDLALIQKQQHAARHRCSAGEQSPLARACSTPWRTAQAELATLRVTALPIASLLVGARSAREEASSDQPPPGGAHATRASLSVNGLLPTAACSVSARAERADSTQPKSQQTRHSRRQISRPANGRSNILRPG